MNYAKVTIYKDVVNWSISWYSLDKNGKPQRNRQTFNLNKIKDLTHRETRAKEIAATLEKEAFLNFSQWKTPKKLPKESPKKTNLRAIQAKEKAVKLEKETVLNRAKWDTILNNVATTEWTLIEAVNYALNLKIEHSDRSRTHETFKMYIRSFEQFLLEMEMIGFKLVDFKQRNAQLFLDWLAKDKERGGATIKNYRTGLRSLFMELEDREMIVKNPFTRTKTIKIEGAKRRSMTENERKIILNALYKENPFLLLGALFQYYCAVRPAEMRRLKVYMIDINGGLIQMSSDITKNHDRSQVTIPKAFKSILEAFSIGNLPPNHFIFGQNMKPHPTIQIGEKTLSNTYRLVLKRLEKTGELSNIEGLQFYSWKDTGAINLVDSGISINDIMLHLRHKSLDYTQRYLSKNKGVIKSIRDAKNDIVDMSFLREKLL